MALCDIEAIVGPLAPVTGGCNGEGEFTTGTISMSDVSTDTGLVVDAVPFERADFTIPIGREARDYRLTLGTRLWAPLTIVGAEWTGQYFNRTRRV